MGLNVVKDTVLGVLVFMILLWVSVVYFCITLRNKASNLAVEKESQQALLDQKVDVEDKGEDNKEQQHFSSDDLKTLGAACNGKNPFLEGDEDDAIDTHSTSSCESTDSSGSEEEEEEVENSIKKEGLALVSVEDHTQLDSHVSKTGQHLKPELNGNTFSASSRSSAGSIGEFPDAHKEGTSSASGSSSSANSCHVTNNPVDAESRDSKVKSNAESALNDAVPSTTLDNSGSSKGLKKDESNGECAKFKSSEETGSSCEVSQQYKNGQQINRPIIDQQDKGAEAANATESTHFSKSPSAEFESSSLHAISDSKEKLEVEEVSGTDRSAMNVNGTENHIYDLLMSMATAKSAIIRVIERKGISLDSDIRHAQIVDEVLNASSGIREMIDNPSHYNAFIAGMVYSAGANLVFAYEVVEGIKKYIYKNIGQISEQQIKESYGTNTRYRASFYQLMEMIESNIGDSAVCDIQSAEQQVNLTVRQYVDHIILMMKGIIYATTHNFIAACNIEQIVDRASDTQQITKKNVYDAISVFAAVASADFALLQIKSCFLMSVTDVYSKSRQLREERISLFISIAINFVNAVVYNNESVLHDIAAHDMAHKRMINTFRNNVFLKLIGNASDMESDTQGMVLISTTGVENASRDILEISIGKKENVVNLYAKLEQFTIDSIVQRSVMKEIIEEVIEEAIEEAYGDNDVITGKNIFDIARQKILIYLANYDFVTSKNVLDSLRQHALTLLKKLSEEVRIGVSNNSVYVDKIKKILMKREEDQYPVNPSDLVNAVNLQLKLGIVKVNIQFYRNILLNIMSCMIGKTYVVTDEQLRLKIVRVYSQICNGISTDSNLSKDKVVSAGELLCMLPPVSLSNLEPLKIVSIVRDLGRTDASYRPSPEDMPIMTRDASVPNTASPVQSAESKSIKPYKSDNKFVKGPNTSADSVRQVDGADAMHVTEESVSGCAVSPMVVTVLTDSVTKDQMQRIDEAISTNISDFTSSVISGSRSQTQDTKKGVPTDGSSPGSSVTYYDKHKMQSTREVNPIRGSNSAYSVTSSGGSKHKIRKATPVGSDDSDGFSVGGILSNYLQEKVYSGACDFGSDDDYTSDDEGDVEGNPYSVISANVSSLTTSKSVLPSSQKLQGVEKDDETSDRGIPSSQRLNSVRKDEKDIGKRSEASKGSSDQESNSLLILGNQSIDETRELVTQIPSRSFIKPEVPESQQSQRESDGLIDQDDKIILVNLSKETIRINTKILQRKLDIMYQSFTCDSMKRLQDLAKLDTEFLEKFANMHSRLIANVRGVLAELGKIAYGIVYIGKVKRLVQLNKKHTLKIRKMCMEKFTPEIHRMCERKCITKKMRERFIKDVEYMVGRNIRTELFYLISGILSEQDYIDVADAVYQEMCYRIDKMHNEVAGFVLKYVRHKELPKIRLFRMTKLDLEANLSKVVKDFSQEDVIQSSKKKVQSIMLLIKHKKVQVQHQKIFEDVVKEMNPCLKDMCEDFLKNMKEGRESRIIENSKELGCAELIRELTEVYVEHAVSTLML